MILFSLDQNVQMIWTNKLCTYFLLKQQHYTVAVNILDYLLLL